MFYSQLCFMSISKCICPPKRFLLLLVKLPVSKGYEKIIFCEKSPLKFFCVFDIIIFVEQPKTYKERRNHDGFCAFFCLRKNSFRR